MKKIVIENKEQGIRIEYPAELGHCFMLLTTDNAKKAALSCCYGHDGNERFAGFIIDVAQVRGIRSLTDLELDSFKQYQKSKQ